MTKFFVFIARPVRRLWATGLVVFGSAACFMPAHAAGGHHAVDDANLLEPGQCKLELWGERESGAARTLVHAGPGCRVGAVELGLNVEREKFAGQGGSSSFAPQVKWATGLNDVLSVGLVASARWSSQAPRYQGYSLVVPLTWQVSDSLSAHVNWGRDFQRRGPDQARGGVALEWSPLKDWSFVVERFRQSDASSARAGVRWTISPEVSLDLSRARTLGADGPGWWTAGINWTFDRAVKVDGDGLPKP